jgi:hypothetical protein
VSDVNTGGYQSTATSPGVPSVAATTRAVPSVIVSANTGPPGPPGPQGPPGDPTELIDDTTPTTTTTYSSQRVEDGSWAHSRVTEVIATDPRYGCKGDARYVTVSIGAGGTTITGSGFSAADTGRLISIPNAGAAGPLNTTVTYVSATTLTAATAATTGVSNASAVLGTDDTTAARAAFAAAITLGVPCTFPPVKAAGTVYLITNSLWDSFTDGDLSTGWTLRGTRTARGQNASNITYWAVSIAFRPTDLTKPLSRAYNLAVPLAHCGPFEQVGIRLDFGDAHGQVFGVQDPANPTQVIAANPVPPVDGSGQAYVFGVTHRQCTLAGTVVNRASNASGVITRTGKVALSLVKAFECVTQDTSIYGGDIGVSWYGCDTPTLAHCRLNGQHEPVRVRAAGSFAVQYRMTHCQIESWTFAAVSVMGTSNAIFSADHIRTENQDGIPAGRGRYTLPQTATWAVQGTTLTFSADMTNVLFPFLSVIEVTDPLGFPLQLLVTAVNGTSVTVPGTNAGGNFLFFAGTNATVTRIHGMAWLVGDGGVSLDQLSMATTLNCPAVVFVPGAGGQQLSVSNAHQSLATGTVTGGVNNSIVLANQLNNNTQNVAKFTNCDAGVNPEPGRPYAVVTPGRRRYGQIFNFNPAVDPGPIRSAGEQWRAVKRGWGWVPGDDSRVSGLWTGPSAPVRKTPDEPNTTQAPWSWHRNASVGGKLALADQTLPSTAANFVKITARLAWTGEANKAVTLEAYGTSFAAITTGWTLPAVANQFQEFSVVVPVPTPWTTAMDQGWRGLALSGHALFCQGVWVEEIIATNPTVQAGPGAPTLALANGSIWQRTDGAAGSTLYARVAGAWSAIA